MRALVALALALTGCYAPEIADGQYSCRGTQKGCPDNFVCDPCNLCVRPGHESDPASCGAPSGGACSRGVRSGGDPQLPAVAFCPGAWRVPGALSPASLDTPCNHAPGDDGTSNGTDCTIADNCAAGWHVCRSDAELLNNGLAPALCAGQTGGFWATRQMGGMNFDCAAVGANNVLGCGDLGQPANTCSVIARALTADDCMATPLPWSCGQPGTPEDRSEGLLVIKTAMDGGGVLCCQDP